MQVRATSPGLFSFPINISPTVGIGDPGENACETSELGAAKTSLAPRLARSVAVDSPIPLPAPVIATTLPSILVMAGSLPGRCTSIRHRANSLADAMDRSVQTFISAEPAYQGAHCNTFRRGRALCAFGQHFGAKSGSASGLTLRGVISSPHRTQVRSGPAIRRRHREATRLPTTAYLSLISRWGRITCHRAPTYLLCVH
jgi:hypothetical protein